MNTKYCFELFSFYDFSSIEKRLEEMALKGWMIESISGEVWKYYRIEPRKIRFRLAYSNSTSSFDSTPSDEQAEIIEDAKQRGWKLLISIEKMMLFYTYDTYAPDLEPDSNKRLDMIDAAARRTYILRIVVSTISLALYFYTYNIGGFFNDAVKLLASSEEIFFISILLLWYAYELSQLIRYKIWKNKAVESIKYGEKLEVEDTSKLNFVFIYILIFLVLFLVVNMFFARSYVNFLSVLGASLFAVIAYLAGVFALKNFKEKQYTKSKNMSYTFVLSIVFYGLIFFIGFRGIRFLEDSETIARIETEQMAINMTDFVRNDDFYLGNNYTLYETFDDSIFFNRTEYRQTLHEKDDDKVVSKYLSMSFVETRVNMPFLYDFALNNALNREEKYLKTCSPYYAESDYSEVDAGIWQADKAYESDRIYKKDKLNGKAYVLCYDDRIFELRFNYELDDGEKERIGEILHKVGK